MNQNIWGPHLWFSLHSMSFNYPLKPSLKDKNNYKNFFLNLQEVIPCSVCKKNYKRHLNEHPIQDYLDNRKSLVYWVIDMHNMVNAEIGKKILSYDIVIKKYENVYQKKIILNNEDNEEDINEEDNDLEYKNELNSINPNINYVNIIYIIFSFFIILLIINLISIILKKK
jgi:hypothetical protein